jgi:hypothetical protein
MGAVCRQASAIDKAILPDLNSNHLAAGAHTLSEAAKIFVQVGNGLPSFGSIRDLHGRITDLMRIGRSSAAGRTSTRLSRHAGRSAGTTQQCQSTDEEEVPYFVDHHIRHPNAEASTLHESRLPIRYRRGRCAIPSRPISNHSPTA